MWANKNPSNEKLAFSPTSKLNSKFKQLFVGETLGKSQGNPQGFVIIKCDNQWILEELVVNFTRNSKKKNSGRARNLHGKAIKIESIFFFHQIISTYFFLLFFFGTVEADRQMNATIERRGYSTSELPVKEKPSTILKKIEIGTNYMKKYLAESMDGWVCGQTGWM